MVETKLLEIFCIKEEAKLCENNTVTRDYCNPGCYDVTTDYGTYPRNIHSRE